MFKMLDLYKKKITECTPEILRNLSDTKGVYFRFQAGWHEIGKKSWGMIYTSEEEAIECCEDDGLTPETAVMPGKSCCPDALGLMEWKDYFDNDYVVIAFKGADTGVTGHDGEWVCDVLEVLKVFTYSDFVNCFKKDGWVYEYKE
jgi:hypothetical protein